MQEATDITTRLYEEGDEHHILGLREELDEITATDKGTLPHWRHEMKDNPAGHALIPLAFARDKLVSHLVMKPRRLRAFGHDMLAYQWIDVMTHPGYRKLGLLTRIELEAEVEAVRRGCCYFLGFPNANSYYPYVEKYGSRRIAWMPLLVRPLAPARGDGPGSRVREAARFDERFDGLLERFASAYPVHFARDAETLDWRYVDVPGRRYRIFYLDGDDGPEAFAAWRITRFRGMRIAVLMDMHMTGHVASGVRFLEAVLRIMVAEEGARLAFAMFLPHTPPHRMCLRNGFVPVPRWANPHSVAKIGKTTQNWRMADPGPVYRASNWYVSFGDSDVF